MYICVPPASKIMLESTVFDEKHKQMTIPTKMSLHSKEKHKQMTIPTKMSLHSKEKHQDSIASPMNTNQ